MVNNVGKCPPIAEISFAELLSCIGWFIMGFVIEAE